MSLTPPSLPPYIFLMSDHTTAKLAHDVAEALSAKYPSVYVDDFLAPIYEGYAAMFELDWKRDMGNPESVEATQRDHIVSLEKWYIGEFGETALGHMGRARAEARNEVADYITVFRDATRQHIRGFINQGAGHGIPDTKGVTLTADATVESTLKLIEG